MLKQLFALILPLQSGLVCGEWTTCVPCSVLWMLSIGTPCPVRRAELCTPYVHTEYSLCMYIHNQKPGHSPSAMGSHASVDLHGLVHVTGRSRQDGSLQPVAGCSCPVRFAWLEDQGLTAEYVAQMSEIRI